MRMRLQKIFDTLHKEKIHIVSFPDNLEDLGGTLNHVFKLEDKRGEQYMLRIPKAEYRGLIRDYLLQLYRDAGFVTRGNEFFHRTLMQQAKFSWACKKKGILVPDVLLVGKDFLLTRFIDGELYTEAVKQNCKAISILFPALINAHRKGIVFGDRWGGNELIVGNQICFLDFDIGYLWENESQFQKCKNFELAVAAYGSTLFCSRKGESIRIIENIFKKNRVEYNLECVNKYLKGYVKFYSNPKKPITTLSAHFSKYQQTNRYVTKLILCLQNQI